MQPCLKYFLSLWWILVPSLFYLPARAQAPADRLRLSPALKQLISQAGPTDKWLIRVYLPPRGPKDTDLFPLTGIKVRSRLANDNYQVVVAEASLKEIRQLLADVPQVLFIETYRKPQKELVVGSMDLSLNAVRLAQERFPGVSGSGETASLKEDRPDADDIDILGRILPSDYASSRTDGHATLMATIMAGAGNSGSQGKGAAPAAALSPADFSTLLPEPEAYYRDGRIHVQNHSYGVDVESYYGPDAASYDASAIANPALVHVFSAGNRGNAAAPSGPYQGISPYANLTGSFKQSKNSIVVGAVDSFGRIALLSSRGPAHDGRVKPELTAFGEDGTSGAAALVSGAALLLQQAYQQQHGTVAPNALVRNLLINAAEDLGNPGADYQYGFGNLNAFRALQILHRRSFASATVTMGEQYQLPVKLPSGQSRFQVTLSWNDPPASPNTEKALMQDLDLEIVHTASGRRWLPWVLSTFPHPDSLGRPAIPGRDSLNTIEQVTINLPDTGTYVLIVRGQSLSGPQPFFLSWRSDAAQTVHWLYPVHNDVLTAGRTQVLRWFSEGVSGAAMLSYSLDAGQHWQLAGTVPDLSSGAFRWQSPQASGPLLLRLVQGASVFLSDTVSLSPEIESTVGFSCPDSFLVQWRKVPNADHYRIFRLQDNVMSVYATTPDTLAVLANRDFPGDYVAIEAGYPGVNAARGLTFKHTNQGVACYIAAFRGEAFGDLANLYLQIGTLYGVQRVVLEKWNGNQFLPVAEQGPRNDLNYRFEGLPMIRGVNRYRARIDLHGGKFAFSLPEDLFYTGPAGFRLYPSLVRQGQEIQIVLNDLPDNGIITVVDPSGRRVRTETIQSIPQSLSTAGLVPGTYFLQVFIDGRQTWVDRFVVIR